MGMRMGWGWDERGNRKKEKWRWVEGYRKG